MCFTWWDKLPWNEQIKKMQTDHHATTCRKKKGVACRLNALWAPSDKTRIVDSEEKICNWSIWFGTLRNFRSVWYYTRTLWKCIRVFGKKVSILQKLKPNEVNIEPFNTVLLKFLKFNINFVTDVYMMLTYLTSFMQVWTCNVQTSEKGIKGSL